MSALNDPAPPDLDQAGGALRCRLTCGGCASGAKRTSWNADWTPTGPGLSSLPLPADALGGVLEDDSLPRELVPDGVGGLEVPGLLGGLSGLDALQDPGFVG